MIFFKVKNIKEKPRTFSFLLTESIFKKMLKEDIGNFLKHFFLQNKIERKESCIPKSNFSSERVGIFSKLIKENGNFSPSLAMVWKQEEAIRHSEESTELGITKRSGE